MNQHSRGKTTRARGDDAGADGGPFDRGLGLLEEPVDRGAGLLEAEHVLEREEPAGYVDGEPHPPVPQPLRGAYLAVPVVPPAPPPLAAAAFAPVSSVCRHRIQRRKWRFKAEEGKIVGVHKSC